MDDWRSYDDVAETYERVHAPRFAEAARDLVGALAIARRASGCSMSGTGTGAAADEVARTGAKVVGVDRSLGMLSVGHRERPSLPSLAAEALDLPFRDRTFDVVMGNFVFAHFAKVETALFDLTRVLAPSGTDRLHDVVGRKGRVPGHLDRAHRDRHPAGHAGAGVRGGRSGPRSLQATRGDRGGAPQGRVPSHPDRAEALPVDLPPGRPRRGSGDLGGGSLRPQHARRVGLGIVPRTRPRRRSRTGSPTR